MLARAGLVKHNYGWYVGPRLLIDDYDEFPIEHPSVRPFIESTAISEAAGYIPEHNSYYNVIMEWGIILVFLKENQSEYHILVDMLRDRITTRDLPARHHIPAGRSK